MGTIRRTLIRLLEIEPLGLRDLSQAARIPEKQVADHLSHIARTLKAQGRSLEILPFECFGCGFVFKDRTRYKRPGRCPKCRSTRIATPLFRIGSIGHAPPK